MAVESFYLPFALTHPLGDKITTTDTEKCAVRFGCDRFSQVGFASSRWSVEQDTFPGLPLAHEQVRELDGEDDGFLECFFCAL